MTWREPVGTGTTGYSPGQVAIAARLAAADVPGQHLWVITAAWHVISPSAGDGLLDTENLIMFSGVLCYKCGAVYHDGDGDDGCRERRPGTPRSRWRRQRPAT